MTYIDHTSGTTGNWRGASLDTAYLIVCTNVPDVTSLLLSIYGVRSPGWYRDHRQDSFKVGNMACFRCGGELPVQTNGYWLQKDDRDGVELYRHGPYCTECAMLLAKSPAVSAIMRQKYEQEVVT